MNEEPPNWRFCWLKWSEIPFSMQTQLIDELFSGGSFIAGKSQMHTPVKDMWIVPAELHAAWHAKWFHTENVADPEEWRSWNARHVSVFSNSRCALTLISNIWSMTLSTLLKHPFRIFFECINKCIKFQSCGNTFEGTTSLRGVTRKRRRWGWRWDLLLSGCLFCVIDEFY